MYIFAGNPHAVVKDKKVVGIIYVSDKPNSLSSQLASYDYDLVINCSKYGREIFIGEDVLEDGYVRCFKPYPSWVWDPGTYTWRSPILHPIEVNPLDNREYYWNEDLGTWAACEFCGDGNLVAGPMPDQESEQAKTKKDLLGSKSLNFDSKDLEVKSSNPAPNPKMVYNV